MPLQFRAPTDILALYAQQRQSSLNGLNQSLQNISSDAHKQQMLRQRDQELERRRIEEENASGQRQTAINLQTAQMGAEAGVQYDPNNPAPFFEAHSKKRKLADELTQSQINKNNQVGEEQDSLEKILAKKVRDGELDIEKAFEIKAKGSPAFIAGTTKANKEKSALDETFTTYETARDGLLTGLGNTQTGPIVGRLPAFTSAQQTAEGGVAAMAPVLKQLFRVAGEGQFTDKDQALLMSMVPTRTDNPEAIKNKIANIDNIVKAKLGKGNSASGGGGQSSSLPSVGGTFQGGKVLNVRKVR